MKVECTEENGVKHHPYYLSFGDVVTVPDDVGQLMVDNGWCTNIETGEQGERQTNQSTTLDVQNGKHSTKSTEV